MRVVFGAVLVACALGAALAALDGDGRKFALSMVGIWVFGALFIAMSLSAAAKRGDRDFGRDEE